MRRAGAIFSDPKLSVFVLAFVFVVIFSSTVGANDIVPDIRPGDGVSEQRRISDYFPPLIGTNLDIDLFILDSGQPGATALIVGGTHANELAGQVAALVMVESCIVKEGKLIVIPYANRSALSVRDTRNQIDQAHLIETRSGRRFMPYGDRRTDLKDQGVQDPDSYTNPVGYRFANGKESRNLNRAYPGKPDGTPTEQLAYAILTMIKKENVDFCLDLHEAQTPERKQQKNADHKERKNRLSYTLVSHPRGLEVAALALLMMGDETGISILLEESPSKLRGLSHLEIGNATRCLSFVSESPNPGQDKWRDRPDVIGDDKYPLKHRVGMHLRLFKHLADSFADNSGKKVMVEGLPEYQDLMDRGVGHFLN